MTPDLPLPSDTDPGAAAQDVRYTVGYLDAVRAALARHHPTDNLQENHYGTLRRVERRRTGLRSAVRQPTQRGGIGVKAIALTRAFDPKILVTQAADAFTRRCSPTSNTCLLAERTPEDKSLHHRRCYVCDPDAFLQRLERRE